MITKQDIKQYITMQQISLSIDEFEQLIQANVKIYCNGPIEYLDQDGNPIKERIIKNRIKVTLDIDLYNIHADTNPMTEDKTYKPGKPKKRIYITFYPSDNQEKSLASYCYLLSQCLCLSMDQYHELVHKVKPNTVVITYYDDDIKYTDQHGQNIENYYIEKAIGNTLNIDVNNIHANNIIDECGNDDDPEFWIGFSPRLT